MFLGSILVILVSVALLVWRQAGKKARRMKRISSKPSVTEAESGGAVSKKITVLFGTQTGTAENFAKVLSEEMRTRYRKHANVVLVDLDEYAGDDSEYLEKLEAESLVLFVTATYGDGEPTDNAVRFMKWLTSKGEEEEGTGILGSISFAVFGLGNRQYEHFNAVGKAVDTNMVKLGGQRLVAVGLGDDDQCIEDDFNQWKEALFVELDRVLTEGQGNGEMVVDHSYAVAVPAYRVELHPLGTPDVAPPVPGPIPLRRSISLKSASADAHPHCRVPVAVCRELHTAASERSCVHVELDIRSSGLSYETGDHVAIFAENEPEVVEAAAQVLGMSLDTAFTLHVDAEPGSEGVLPDPFPGPVTLRTALARYADLLNPPRKSALLALAAHASSAEEAQRLQFLASAAGKEEFSSWITEVHRSLLEVMEAFPSARPPLGVFFGAVAARLQPRFYSISSSPRFAPGYIHVTCAVVEETTPGGRLHRGVCSYYLKRAVTAANDPARCTAVPVFVRSSTFKLPANPELPLIMVGPGTGLAPFRGFLQERAALLRDGQTLGPAVLFFGCRNSSKDFIYQEELEAFLREGAVTSMSVAFSRDGPAKEYVQHHMLEQAAELWKLMEAGGYLYVCGDAKAMAKDVHRALHTIIIEQGGVSSSKAEDVVKRWQQSGRYLRDIW